MKLLLTLISCLFIGCISFAQARDTYQADSVYKKNHVRKRTMHNEGAGTKAGFVITYDREGRMTSYSLTDNETGKINQFIITYLYDDSGRCVHERYDAADSENTTTDRVYDSLNRFAGKMTYDSRKKLVSSRKVSYDPYTETETFYDANDSIVRQQTAYYSMPNAYYRFTGFEIKDGEKSNWDYSYINVLDAKNRLVIRVATFMKPNKFLNYFYDTKGLLIKKTELIGTGPSHMTEIYRYEYWK